MTDLSPTGARILDTHDNGVVTGHAAALAKLEGDGLVVPHCADGGTHWMTEAGWAALDAWRQAHPARSTGPDLPPIPPKLPAKQHEAVVTAARRPDQLVAGRDDRAYWKGEPWFNGRTLTSVYAAGYAAPFPQPWHHGDTDWGKTIGGSLYLTPAGRAYARIRGNIDVHRRKVVIIACGQEKAPARNLDEYGGDIDEFGNPVYGYPAGELYIGQYHRSLRLAADALTHPDLILIASALHGLVPLDRPLRPYDVTLGDEKAITAEKMAGHTAGYGLSDADVIFLGGQKYAELLRPSVPYLLAPLTGGMGGHRGMCKQAREDAAVRAAWWKAAAARGPARAVDGAGPLRPTPIGTSAPSAIGTP
ncbi:DUF6884 domain-containing protein [Streptomyces sp. NPDC058268]|uniref:DUF6884 domain-containing protein n=1 Tax=Streptomyces sp. NPDC058268 TaxID=3346413 RepID=UPI0036F01525